MVTLVERRRASGSAAMRSTHEPTNQMFDRWCSAHSGVGRSSFDHRSIAASAIVITSKPSSRFMSSMVVTGRRVPENLALAALDLAELRAQRIDLHVEFSALLRDLPFVLFRDLVRKARQPVVELAPQRRALALLGLELLESRPELALALFFHQASLTSLPQSAQCPR